MLSFKAILEKSLQMNPWTISALNTLIKSDKLKDT